jgi:protein TonB
MKRIRLLAVVAATALIGGQAHAQASKPIPKRWNSSDDYPANALVHNHQGTTYVTLTIDEGGKPRKCVVTKSSGFADLDEATCKVFLKRAHFIPATDDNGTPIEAPFPTEMNWRIPK